MIESSCPFCILDEERVIFKNKSSYALLDIFPVSKGHTLIIPKRHILNLDELTNDEVVDFFETIIKVKKALDKILKPDGFNIGINLGETSGQTIEHIHIHLIPRYKKDTKFPFGGIRKVVLDFIDFEVSDLKNRWIKNRLRKEEIKILKDYLKNNR